MIRLFLRWLWRTFKSPWVMALLITIIFVALVWFVGPLVAIAGQQEEPRGALAGAGGIAQALDQIDLAVADQQAQVLEQQRARVVAQLIE